MLAAHEQGICKNTHFGYSHTHYGYEKEGSRQGFSTAADDG